MFLSPNYDVVRFKGSNAFMNKITVPKRLERINLFTLGRNLALANDQKFIKEKSVWKTYQDDEPEHLLKCLEQDLAFGKIQRLTKEDFPKLKAALLNDYLQLKNIFTQLAVQSSYPVISWNDYSFFVNRSKIPDKKVNISEIDRALIGTNFSQNGIKNSAEKELHRYEFLEVIIRLGQLKYLTTKIAKDFVEAYQMLVKDIFQYNPKVEGLSFRLKQMYTLKCDELFRKNEEPIKQLEEPFFTPAKKFLTIQDVIKVAEKSEIKVSQVKLTAFYAESLSTRIDTLTDLSVMQQMKHVEFICWISRLAHEVYLETKLNKLGLHLKVDLLLTKIFEKHGLTKNFSFKEELGDIEVSEDEEEGEASPKKLDEDE